MRNESRTRAPIPILAQFTDTQESTSRPVMLRMSVVFWASRIAYSTMGQLGGYPARRPASLRVYAPGGDASTLLIRQGQDEPAGRLKEVALEHGADGFCGHIHTAIVTHGQLDNVGIPAEPAGT